VAANNRDVHATAHRGAQDFQAVADALQTLTTKLAGTWDIRMGQESSQALPVAPDALTSLFQDAYRRAGESFLRRETQKGNTWTTIDAYIFSSDDRESIVRRRNYLKLLAWNSIKGKLLEALCLLSTLSDYAPEKAGTSVNLFARLGPLAMQNGDGKFALWTRPLLRIEKTGLKACPDLVLTKDQERPTKTNMLWIAECKYRTALNAQELRSEFGKAWELKAPSYTIVSYNPVSERIRRAAKALGLDVVVFPLSSDKREDYLGGQLSVAEDLTAELTESLRRKRYLDTVELASAEMREKVLLG
jgi:hypothetical protein